MHDDTDLWFVCFWGGAFPNDIKGNGENDEVEAFGSIMTVVFGTDPEDLEGVDSKFWGNGDGVEFDGSSGVASSGRGRSVLNDGIKRSSGTMLLS